MSKFGDDMRAFVAKTKVTEVQMVRYAISRITTEMIERSPVDTGRFRGNWFFGVGSPVTTTMDIEDKTGGLSLARIAQGAAGIEGPGVFYITNSLPYARRLEYDGWSSQAPQGFVRLSVQNFAKYLEEFVRSMP